MAFEPLGRQRQELGGGGQVPKCAGRLDMPQVSGQQGQTGLHVTTVEIPAEQGPDRERMPEVVDTGTSLGPPGHQPNLGDQFMKGRVWAVSRTGARWQPRSISGDRSSSRSARCRDEVQDAGGEVDPALGVVGQCDDDDTAVQVRNAGE